MKVIKQLVVILIVMYLAGACQPRYLSFKTRDNSKPTKVAGRGVQYFYKKEVDDLLQQYKQIVESEHTPGLFFLHQVIVKKHKGDRIGLFTLSPDPTLHGTTHYGKVLKFADTTIINFNGYREIKNILPPNKMFGAMRYFKQLYSHRFTKEELEKIEQSFYKGVMRITAYRGYYYESEKL